LTVNFIIESATGRSRLL